MTEANNRSALFDLVGVLARRRHQVGERSFAALGLNHTEARLLSLLAGRDGEAAQDELSSLLFIDRSNAGRALKGLEGRGFVERDKTAGDGRTNSVRMTPEGSAASARIAKLRREMARDFFGKLSEEEAGAIVARLSEAMDLGPSLDGRSGPSRVASKENA